MFSKALLFPVTTYGGSCEITDVNMDSVPVHCRVPSLSSTLKKREKPGQGPAKLQQQLSGKGVGNRREAVGREGAEKPCYDPI